MTVLVDSDVLIDVSRGNDLATIAKWNELSQSGDPVLYSPASAAELWAGARPAEHDALTNLFGNLVCVPIDSETGRLAGDYLRRYHKSHALALGAALVAAAASRSQATLWTRNRKHYPMTELSFF